MKLKLEVVFADGQTANVETNLWVITQWERKYRTKVSAIADGIGAEDLAFMAYSACQQQGLTVPIVFDDFVKKLDAVNVLDSEADNPTPGAPTDAA